MSRALRSIGKQVLLRAHEIGLGFNLFVLPKHYYVPIADVSELRRTRSRWARRSAMVGIDVDLDAQGRRLRELVKPFQSEYADNAAYKEAKAGVFGPGYGYIEAQALHGILRALKPKRIIEVGSGMSTFCMLAALEQNAVDGVECTLTCIEPHPSEWLQNAPVRLIRSRLQDVDRSVFDELEAGDFLFVDSTHTVKVDGDVNTMILEILPRLKVGTTVHFHDIYLPYDFQRNADRTIFQWMETAMLHAFLTGNRAYEILFCLSHLHYDRPDVLADIFPGYKPLPDVNGLLPDGVRGGGVESDGHFPSSIYLRVVEPLE